jgi:hypothetical protein
MFRASFYTSDFCVYACVRICIQTRTRYLECVVVLYKCIFNWQRKDTFMYYYTFIHYTFIYYTFLYIHIYICIYTTVHSYTTPGRAHFSRPCVYAFTKWCKMCVYLIQFGPAGDLQSHGSLRILELNQRCDDALDLQETDALSTCIYTYICHDIHTYDIQHILSTRPALVSKFACAYLHTYAYIHVFT